MHILIERTTRECIVTLQLRRRRSHCFILPILVFLMLSPVIAQTPAQGLPSEEVLMKGMAEAAEKRQTLQYVAEVQFEAVQGNQRVDRLSGASTVRVVFASPDKLFVDEEGSRGGRVQLSDGNLTWKYDPQRKQYMKINAGYGLNMLAMPMPGLIEGLPAFDASGISSVVREELIEVDGEKRDCWVAISALTVPPQWSTAVITSWIDKQ